MRVAIAAVVMIALALAVYLSVTKKTVGPEPDPSSTDSLQDLNLPSYATRGPPTTAPSTIVEQVNE